MLGHSSRKASAAAGLKEPPGAMSGNPCDHPHTKHYDLLTTSGSSQVKNYCLGYMGQAPSRGHEASLQSGLRAGSMLCSCSRKLRGLSAHAQARRISSPPSFSVAGVSPFMYLLRSAMRRGAWKFNTRPR